MKIITCNVNGIRSASSKAIWPWIISQEADVICFQEIRATEEQFPQDALNVAGYHRFICCANRPGYSGVAIYTKHSPLGIVQKMGHDDLDSEGRFLQIDLESVSILSVYFPSGSSGPDRQSKKYEFLDHFFDVLREFRKSGKAYIICGDWNIAHKEIDLKNWRGNRKNSGFLPEERAWMDKVFDDLGFVDAFRIKNPEPDQYTWWSNRGRARENNVGWRIDYQIVTPCLKEKIKSVSIYKDTFFSDHAPLTITYDL